MKTRSILCAFTCVVLLSVTSAHAKKPPAPPPTISASISADVQVQAEVLPPSIPIYSESIKLSLAHSFEITPQIEAALQSDTTISLLGVEFTPGQDPQFQNGDKSAVVQGKFPIGLAISEELPVTIKTKWGNNKFSATIKGTIKSKNIAVPPTPLEIVQQLTGQNVAVTKEIVPRVDSALELISKIQHPSIPTLTVGAWIACDQEVSATEGVTAEGGQYLSQSTKIASKFFTTPPAP